MILQVHHVSFTVTDMERSLKFYRDGLGFELLSDRIVSGRFPETVSGLPKAELRIAHLKAYDQGLELIQYIRPTGERQAVRTCDAGSAHMCFVVEGIDAEVERLTTAGARFISEPQTVEGGPNAGNRCVYFLDPDGIPMELTERA